MEDLFKKIPAHRCTTQIGNRSGGLRAMWTPMDDIKCQNCNLVKEISIIPRLVSLCCCYFYGIYNMTFVDSEDTSNIYNMKLCTACYDQIKGIIQHAFNTNHRKEQSAIVRT
jgi:hypothetical protein